MSEIKYNAVYKCRLCGEEFVGYESEGYQDTCLFVMEICDQPNYNYSPYKEHICNNGDIGFADFLGCRKAKGRYEE